MTPGLPEGIAHMFPKPMEPKDVKTIQRAYLSFLQEMRQIHGFQLSDVRQACFDTDGILAIMFDDAMKAGQT